MLYNLILLRHIMVHLLQTGKRRPGYVTGPQPHSHDYSDTASSSKDCQNLSTEVSELVSPEEAESQFPALRAQQTL